ncbi:hypothetical protein ACGFNU_18420 [Spirillospora sp. NPDC048911]|uniref:hypothetical protein n=1 Tax=Spirillospora sp. NPDC048911 TaxID=3364527 RepID=UPI003711A525
MQVPSPLAHGGVPPCPASWDRQALHGPRSADEAVLAIALTLRWMLSTGRRLHEWPQPHELGGENLIEFWADDHIG